jgi:Xaa-Pro aminopeptidase
MSLKYPYGPRLDRLRKACRRKNLDAFLVWDRANTLYLTGFRGSASLLCLLPEGGYFVTDFRYISVAKASISPLLRVRLGKPAERERIPRLLKRHRARRVGFEETVPYSVYRHWSQDFDGVELVESTELIRRLRERKSRAEVQAIVRAQRIAEHALGRLLKECRPGVAEIALARRLQRLIEEEGGDGASFDPIVASGPNAALPHAHPGDRRLRKGDFVIFDLGVRKDGYASDMTRTVVLGAASNRQKEVYATVLRAQKRAIARVRHGVALRSVDRAARRVIEAKGHGKRFGHGTGHGIGLEVHEAPNMNPRSEGNLRAGTVVTVEPGIYIPRWGGVRIEDMVCVKRSSHEILTKFPKRLIELPCD